MRSGNARLLLTELKADVSAASARLNHMLEKLNSSTVADLVGFALETMRATPPLTSEQK